MDIEEQKLKVAKIQGDTLIFVQINRNRTSASILLKDNDGAVTLSFESISDLVYLNKKISKSLISNHEKDRRHQENRRKQISKDYYCKHREDILRKAKEKRNGTTLVPPISK